MPNRKLQAKIKIAQKQLGMEDGPYRDLLYRKFRVSSSRSLSDSQANVLISHFKRLGWQPKASRLSPLARKYSDSPRDLYDASGAIKRKIEAMWHDLYRGNDETKHLRQFLFNHFKVSDINFLDRRTAYEAVEALKNMTRRRARLAESQARQGDAEMREPGNKEIRKEANYGR